MLKQSSALQGPSTNSDEFSASETCSSNSNQQGYTQNQSSDPNEPRFQNTSSSVGMSQLAPQGPRSSNEQGNPQSPMSSREVLLLTPSLSSSVTLPAYPHKSKFHRTTFPCESLDSTEFRQHHDL